MRKINWTKSFFLEDLFIDFLMKRYLFFFIMVVTILSLGLRFSVREFISSDMIKFLLPWFDIIKSKGGLIALREQTGDYNILYQTLIALMTYFPFNPVYMYKLLSIFFDYSLAIGVALLVFELSSQKSIEKSLLAYSIVILFPTIVINSAMWGQADSIYTSFIIWSLLAFKKDKIFLSSILMGIAFSFKLQTVFIFPALFIIYLLKRHFSYIKYLILMFITFLVSLLPAIIVGRSWNDALLIYVRQTDTYKKMFANVSSFWTVMLKEGEWGYEYFKIFAILLTFSIIGIFIFQLIRYNVLVESVHNWLSIMIWSLWTVLLFLPGMHERYNYLLEILLFVQGVLNVKKLVYLIPTNIVTLITYFHFLSGGRVYSMLTLSLINIAAYCIYTYKEVFVEMIEKNIYLEKTEGLK